MKDVSRATVTLFSSIQKLNQGLYNSWKSYQNVLICAKMY